MSGTSGYDSRNSLGRGPFGPDSADVVITTGRLCIFPIAACANIALLKRVASQLFNISDGPDVVIVTGLCTLSHKTCKTNLHVHDEESLRER